MAWVLRSFTKQNEGCCEWKPWEQKRVRGSFKVQIKVNQNAEEKEKQLRTQLVKFYVYIHLLVEYTPLSRKYLREVKCPRGKAQMWMEKKAWAGDPQV